MLFREDRKHEEGEVYNAKYFQELTSSLFYCCFTGLYYLMNSVMLLKSSVCIFFSHKYCPKIEGSLFWLTRIMGANY